jgi:hypothetical protein
MRNLQSGDWLDAIGYCEQLSLNGHDDWRLPNIKEIGIQPNYDRTLSFPLAMFNAGLLSSIDGLWTSTHSSATSAYRMNDSISAVDGVSMSTQGNYTCVRTSRGPTLTP